MEKKYFAAKLISPRATFPFDITEAEKLIMQQHAAYIRGFMELGQVVVFGPVLDPAGVYGFAVFHLENEDQLKDILANDPATQIGHYQHYPMMAVVPDK